MNNRDMDRILEKLRSLIGQGANMANKKVNEYRGNPTIVDEPKPEPVYADKQWMRVVGILLAVVGYGWGGVTLLSTLVLLAGAILIDEIGVGLGLSSIGAIVVAGCGFAAWKGTGMITSSERFRIYRKTIGNEELCNIRELAVKVRKTEKYVLKDVEKMIQKGWFCQGHLDKQKTCLMVTDRMFQEYRKIEAEREQHQLEEERQRALEQKEEARRQKEIEAERTAKEKANAEKMSKKKLSPEVEKVIAQGDAYVKKIRQCNDAIPGEEISAKIDRMELLVDKIFDRVEQNPACVGDVRRLLEYYLPMTVKLLDTYAEMDAQPVGGENIQATKKEIEDTLDTINLAFEKLLDGLFQDAAWDVSADISVLQTMLSQEGLTEDQMKKQ